MKCSISIAFIFLCISHVQATPAHKMLPIEMETSRLKARAEIRTVGLLPNGGMELGCRSDGSGDVHGG